MKKKIFQCIVCVLALVIATKTQGQHCYPEWDMNIGSTNGWALALANFGGDVIVGGDFSSVAGTPADSVARWDGQNWSALGNGFNGAVHALAVFNGDLYAGGTFTHSGTTPIAGIARWTGSQWESVGTGLGSNPQVMVLEVLNDGAGPELWAGGNFTAAGGAPSDRVATWNGTSWMAVPGLSDTVRALVELPGNAIYAGGDFAGGVALLSGGSWSVLGAGTNNRVRALEAFDDGGGVALFAGGEFSTAGGVSAANLAKWDGMSWSEPGSGIGENVYSLRAYDDGFGPALFVGARPTQWGGPTLAALLKWDGQQFSTPIYSFNFGNQGIRAMEVTSAGDLVVLANNSFIATGGFVHLYMGCPASFCVPHWDNESGLDGMNQTPSVSEAVHSFVVYDDGGGDALYVGGSFTEVGTLQVNRIAKWDGAAWSALGAGLSGGVRALAVYNGELYAGGFFSTTSVMRWDGQQWLTVGALLGSTSAARALVVHNGELYVGGEDLTVGGSPHSVVKWDGSSWSAVSGINGPVYELAVFDDGGGPALYAGGQFTMAGSATANNIAKWDGSSWSALGAGVTWPGSATPVRAMAVYDDGNGAALYVGGRFDNAGGAAVSNVAKWDGSSWSALGGGAGNLTGEVEALETFDDGSGEKLYAGGMNIASHVVAWDGFQWHPLGLGTDWTVFAFGAFTDGTGPALYAGGSFDLAGGYLAGHIAAWRACPSCGASSSNDCCTFSLSGTPFCDEPLCCDVVCFVDPFCCNIEWDNICASAAVSMCGICTGGPANSLCTTAQPVGAVNQMPFDNFGAPTDGLAEPGCGFDGINDSDVWFAFTATVTGLHTVIVEPDNAPEARHLGVYDGCPAGGHGAIVCDTEPGSGPVSVVWNAVATQTYYIRVGTAPGPAGQPSGQDSFTLTIDVPPPCLADIVGPAGVPDGVVDVFDLLEVIANWGSCPSPPSPCPADISGPADVPDGTVDVFDLLEVIANWGPCP